MYGRTTLEYRTAREPNSQICTHTYTHAVTHTYTHKGGDRSERYLNINTSAGADARPASLAGASL